MTKLIKCEKCGHLCHCGMTCMDCACMTCPCEEKEKNNNSKSESKIKIVRNLGI